MKILMVLTSAKGGTDLSGFCSAYYTLTDLGATVILATLSGGSARLSKPSPQLIAADPLVRRYSADTALIGQLAHTIRLATTGQFFYDAVCYPDGCGWLDVSVTDGTSGFLIANFFKHHKPMAFIGFGMAVLLGVRDPWGKPLLAGKKIAVAVPDNVVDQTASLIHAFKNMIENSGAVLVPGASLVHDDILITGQPGQAGAAVRLVMDMLAAGCRDHIFDTSFPLPEAKGQEV